MMKLEKTITCTVCPKGCRVTVTFDDKGGVKKITGNSCKKGEAYARSELVNPKRVLTTTVRVLDGQKPVVSVKTVEPVPLKKMMRCMEDINQLKVKAPIRIGEEVKADVAGTKVALVATSGVNAISKE